MAYVTDEEREAMARVMAILNGNAPAAPSMSQTQIHESLSTEGGPGNPSQAEIAAMSNVLKTLNKISNEVIMESTADDRLSARTARVPQGVAVGEYKIEIHLNENRTAGKQYYSILHTGMNTVIATEITLYEVALSVVKMLNRNRYVNDPVVRRLFELDERYTGCKTEAMGNQQARRRALARGDSVKETIHETKFQRALEQAGSIKREIRQLLEDCSANHR